MSQQSAPSSGYTGSGSPGQQGQGQAPGGQQQPPAEPKAGDGGDKSGSKESADELRAALEAERRTHKDTKSRLDKLERDRMTDQEKAVTEAKKQGHDEALLVAGKRLAAAEFRAAAAGKIANPSAVVDMVDLSKYVGDDGEPDAKAIAAFVDKLVENLGAQAPANGRVPAGPRGGSEPGSKDGWLRDSIVRG